MKLRVSRMQIALCLVAGVVSTAAVALLGTMFGEVTRLGMGRSASGISISEQRRVGVCRFWSVNVPAALLDTELADDPDWAWEEAETAIVDQALPQPAPRPMRFRLWVFVRAGWPIESFRGWSWQLLDDLGGPNEQISRRHFAIVRVPLLRYGVSQTGHFLVPYYPLWPGFIANSLIYAALWWLVFAGLVSARAARRARHGLCTRCAYDLRGVTLGVCPECGEAHAH
ncbi:MAG: hypothetical protein U0638_10225 [Phycisphaerales bacterium]